MNPFLVYPIDHPRLPGMPGRLYGRLDDAIETAKASDWYLRLGCVDADWFDGSQALVAGPRGNARKAGLEDMKVFLLEFEATNYGGPPTFAWSGKWFGYEDWLEIVVEPGSNASIFRNLYAEGEPISIVSIQAVSGTVRDALEEAHDLDEWAAGDDDVQRALGGSAKRDIESVGVYDVGQGTCVGLCPRGNSPTMYFDFGGGTAVHTSTRPHKTPDLCLCSDPIFVLSHWDADHWSSAPLVPASLNLDWVAPYQSLTPPQIVFAGTIAGKLVVSKAAAGTKFYFANAEIHRAAGPWSDRNNSGFFLVVDAPGAGDPFFFPGDADYANTKGMPSNAAAIAATHHGGNWKSGITPPAAVGGPKRVVFSFGIFSATRSNSYGHPTSSSRGDHRIAGYAGADTPLRAGGQSGNGTGHVHLDWAGSTSIPAAPCGRKSCYQNLDQT